MDLSGRLNILTAIPPTPTTGAVAIFSDYIKMDQYDRVTFVANYCPISTLGSSAGGTTGLVTCSLWGAYSATGGGAQVLGVYTTMGSTAALGSRCDGAAAVVFTGATLSTHGHTLVINGITYTFSTVATVTTGTFAATRLVYIQPTPTAAGCQDTLEHLAAYINHDTWGVTGVHAHVNNARVAITSSSSNHLYITGMGNKTLSIVAASSLHLQPFKYVSLLETNGAEIMSAGSSQRFVALAMTPTSQGTLGAVAIRSKARYYESSTSLVADVGRST